MKNWLSPAKSNASWKARTPPRLLTHRAPQLTARAAYLVQGTTGSTLTLALSHRMGEGSGSLTTNHQSSIKQIMTHQAIGLIETRGLVALIEGTDAMLKAANVELAGPITQVGNALVTAVVVGDVAAVKAATDAGAQAIKAMKGELVSVHVIARPHADVEAVLPKKPTPK